jgi:hypothetical protein
LIPRGAKSVGVSTRSSGRFEIGEAVAVIGKPTLITVLGAETPIEAAELKRTPMVPVVEANMNRSKATR